MGAGCSSDSSVDIAHSNTKDGTLSIVPVSRTPQALPDKATSNPTSKSNISPLLKAKSQKLLHPSPTETAAEDKKILPPTATTSVQTSAIKSPLSSTSKLDLHDVIHERDLDHERTTILNQTLRCHNCEDINAPITSWCDTCPSSDTSPPILCSTCTHAMHKSSKTSSHIRYPFTIHMGNMPTAQELGFVGTMLPPGLPPLGAVACQNCETTQEVSVWCSECHGFYCQPCGRDLHKPKNMSRHIRHPCTYRFIHAQHRGLSAAITETKTSSPIIPISDTTSTSKSIHIPTSHINDSKEQEDQVTELKTNGKSVKTRNAKSAKSTEINDIVPVENGGIAGDIYSLAEITITGTLTMDQLQFRNVVNPYDTIGDVMITHVVCGAQHTGAITALGSLFMWGSNHDHQLGVDLGDEKETRIPQLVTFERHNPVKQIALGTVHSVALCQTGDVYTWGSGIVGILGHETDADRTRPTRLEFLDQDEIHTTTSTSTSTSTSHVEEVVMIAAAHYNTGVVVKNRKDQAQLYIWGEGQSGVIGDGHQKPHLQPCLIRIQQDDTYPVITQLALGARHAVAITQDGAVYSWGSNEYGQLGQNTSSDSTLILTPQRIPYLTVHGISARQVVCGERHTSILSTVGDVWSWGSGETHQLGIFDNVDQFTPVKAQGLGGTSTAPITTIRTGASLSAAITETGEVYMWGWGVETPIPKLVEGLHGHFIQHIGISDHICVLTGCNSEVWELAYNEMEDDIEDVSQRVIPRAVPNKWLRGKRLKCISVGTHHTGIVTLDGKLYMWGSNADMQLGLGNDSIITEMPTPIEIKIKYKIMTLACGAEHNVALTTTGQVLTWGAAGEGRLGHKSGNNCGEPTLVATLASIPCSYVACGATNSAAITRDGQLYIWGAGGSGQIGNGDVMPAFTPTLVTSLTNEKCISISFGLQHVAVLTEKKQIWTWGDNRFGQLSQGLGFDDESSPHPLLVSHLIPLGITPISVSCGDNVTLIVTSQGTCYGWGSGETHQLCTEDSEDVRSPIILNFPKHATKKTVPKIVQLSSHGINCAARSDDGDVYCWGWEFGAQPRLLPPMDPDKPSPCTDLVMGSTHLLAST